VWEEHHHGVEIGGRLWVGPPDEVPPAGLRAVRIEPRGLFGSGAHATTSGCLELLCEVEAATSVLDLGCGSGVLAICAAALGHHPVHACDSDPLAVSAARTNAAVNGAQVDVFEADAATDSLPTAELWLANLAEGPLADVLSRPDRPPAAIVSGLSAGARLDYPGYRVERQLERSGWRAARLHKV
jgi:ribosomal protein L11 methyltransferase